MSTRHAGGMSSQTIVSGTHRFKYFKRPIMPRVSAVAPQVLLAPTSIENPLVPIDDHVEPVVKDQEVQTMYRDSEAQTAPYAPQHVPVVGKDPEILLLKNLTYENGLPLGNKEIEMIEYARAKRDMESSLPPFTDEASLNLRKRLMEQQELREFKMRENEMDKKRDAKLDSLAQALYDREESNEFMTSQRLEGVRLIRMEEREKVLHRIRNKRIKALRRLAHQRSTADPLLTGDSRGDVIDDYYNKGSGAFAPIKREGKLLAPESERFDVSSRTLPLDNIPNILSLEYTIPKKMLDVDMSRTAPAGGMRGASGGVADSRLSSAAQRAGRTTKRDVEEMHTLLQARKREQQAAAAQARAAAAAAERAAATADAGGSESPDSRALAIANEAAAAQAAAQSPTKKTAKGRPPTPDLTRNRPTTIAVDHSSSGHHHHHHRHHNDQADEISAEDAALANDLDFQAAVVLMQRLIRGRAVQNMMFEGKYRRRELIHELKTADLELANYVEPSASEMELEWRSQREEVLRETTADALSGVAASNLLVGLSQEQARIGTLQNMVLSADKAVVDRRTVEGAEAGRRQREKMNYPVVDKLPASAEAPTATAAATAVASGDAAAEGKHAAGEAGDVPAEREQDGSFSAPVVEFNSAAPTDN